MVLMFNQAGRPRHLCVQMLIRPIATILTLVQYLWRHHFIAILNVNLAPHLQQMVIIQQTLFVEIQIKVKEISCVALSVTFHIMQTPQNAKIVLLLIVAIVDLDIE